MDFHEADKLSQWVHCLSVGGPNQTLRQVICGGVLTASGGEQLGALPWVSLESCSGAQHL